MSKLIISEPWDFEDIQGSNELSGRILKRLDSKTLLFRTEEEVTLKGLSSRYWLLSARYEKQSFEEEPYQGTVNGALLPELPLEDESLSKLRQSSVFAIIGCLQA
ncbi:MAG: hypothetical protein CBB60_002160 [Armatimonadetes bacterium Cent15-Ar3]|jgi:hypothetical protein|nr:MAG: hypothetical protein CBB60_002160 [Armatimonadetes bacterium Cent15-Ar3]